ncbi:double-strand break repair protein AddB, partial [Methylobrevis pamukkalensis]|uniref:double-strand break repair protein AddB n=1 Tax=Methylobrevis pamukkalensis TaxID=1439726 RepID=UPI000845FF5D
MSAPGDGIGTSDAAAQPPRVVTIPPGVPFLPTLVDALLSGRLVPGFSHDGDPLALAAVTLLVPTRRAARVLRGVLLDALGGKAALLPRIRPIGDVDEDGDAFAVDLPDLDLPPVIGEADRLLAMARLVAGWRTRLAPQRELTPHGVPIRIPASPADAIHLSRDLLALMDQAAAEEVDWRRLAGLVPDDHAAYWQLTLTFLDIATAAWPAFLAERGLIEPVERRRRLTQRLIDRLAAGAPGPIIAAGSTGSIPTTARLLAAIARLPQGAVVLPGLDTDLDDASFRLIAPPVGPGVPSHPQAALAHLLGVIGLDRRDVAVLGEEDSASAARRRILSEAMRPAETTDRWPAFTAALDEAARQSATDGLSLLVARSPAEEALAIAVALRETVETPGRTAALVTPDRDLARRVCLELQRFGLAVEDSAGETLEASAPALLARLVVETAVSGWRPDTLLALLKHPLAAFGLPRVAARAAARAMEIAVLRGPRLAAGAAPLLTALDRVLVAFETEGARLHPVLRTLGPGPVRAARDLAQRLAEALAPLDALTGRRELPLEALLDAHLAALRRVAADEAGTDARLFAGPAGEELAGFFAAFLSATPGQMVLDTASYPPAFLALIRGRQVHRPVSGEVRISIWGQLEARLMDADRVVLGSLVEGVWPARTDTGPWLSRPMRGELAFAPPERRIGLSAHDFVMRCGGGDVILALPEKRDGAPSVASRWLQRLGAVLGPQTSAQMRARGD